MTENEIFSERDDGGGQITYQLHVNGKLACEVVVLGRNCLMTIDSYPPKRGYGTKMMRYVEKKALENGFFIMEIIDIKDEQYVKDFFANRGYKLEPHPKIQDEFIAKKRLNHS